MKASAICFLILVFSVTLCSAQKGNLKKSKAGWGKWGKFGPCSVTCGGGTTKRYRTCKEKECKGSSSSTRPCRTKKCIAGEWTSWTPFGKCSKSCDGGVKLRKRKCKGKGCEGKKEESKNCNTKKCKGTWGPWVPGKCSRSCGGGHRIRKRECLSKSCVGPSVQRFDCASQDCPPPSVWGRWEAFEPCTKSCGTGIKIRKRTCKTKTCRGPSTQTGKCRTQPCPDPSIWGEWGKFAQCTKSCGAGIKVRTRECKTKTCRGSPKHTANCNTRTCPGDWTPCTKSCGTGTRYKYDSVTCSNPNNPKCLRTFQECNTQPCPKETCSGSSVLRYGSKHSCCHKDELHRIIEGEDAEIERWPWMVLVEIVSRTTCGGSLIHSQWVLTAGHCVDEVGVVGPAGLRVYAGIQKFSRRLKAKPHTVKKIHKHPKSKDLEYDVALLKLTDAVDLFSEKIEIIALPRGEETPLDSTCFTTGWGLTNPTGFQNSEPLQQVSVQILDNAVCQKAYKDNEVVGSYVMTTKRLLCAGSLSKKNDACMGDSGGPLVCQRCSSCEWYLAGVTSFGPEGDCGVPGHPGMYSKVKSFEAWIYSHVPTLKGKSEACGYAYGP